MYGRKPLLLAHRATAAEFRTAVYAAFLFVHQVTAAEKKKFQGAAGAQLGAHPSHDRFEHSYWTARSAGAADPVWCESSRRGTPAPPAMCSTVLRSSRRAPCARSTRALGGAPGTYSCTPCVGSGSSTAGLPSSGSRPAHFASRQRPDVRGSASRGSRPCP